MKIALSSVKNGIDTLTNKIDDKVQNVMGDLIEPLQTYIKHYEEQASTSI
jgi:hypothetical protein